MDNRLRPLLRRAKTLREPVDYFSGHRRSAEPLPDNVLCFLRRAPDELTPRAGDDSFHERWVLLLALEGSGVVRVDRKPYRLRTGHAVLVPPLRLHGFPRADENLRWLFFTFEWPGHAARSAEWDKPRPISPDAARCAGTLLDDLAAANGSGNVIAARLLDLLRHLYPAASAESREPLPGTLLASVQIHAARDPGLCLNELASRLGLSESHLRARFRREAGMSLGRYLRETRLRDAARRLREEGGTVKAAATAAGYPDAFSFSRAFRRVLGVPPDSVRRRA